MSRLVENRVIGCKICEEKKGGGVIIQADDIGRHRPMGAPPPGGGEASVGTQFLLQEHY